VRAAQALEKAFAARGDCEVEHLDVLDRSGPIFRLLFRDIYKWLTAYAPGAMGYLYESFDIPWRNPIHRRAWVRLNTQPLVRYILRRRPDVCVCTHFLPAEVVGRLKARGALAAKNAVVITDFDVQALWLYKPVERYYVNNDEAAAYLERLGVPAGRVINTGIPVDPVFAEPLEKREVRRALGLDPELFTVLVSAGIFAATPIEKVVRDLLVLDRPWQIVAVAGKSDVLFRRLSALTGDAALPNRGRLRVLGFTHEMNRWMAAADLMVGKAGGLSVSEALALGLPLAIIQPIPGVETRNADHLLERGAAVRLNNPAAAAWKIAQLADDPARLAALRAAALAMGRPKAAAAIAADCLEKLIAEPGEAPDRRAMLKAAR
jgi:processive 1,2-diacylglycerol beta-glucosyltransferase